MKLPLISFTFALFLHAQYRISTFAGGGTPDGSPATSVGIGTNQSLAADSFGDVYIASLDQNRVFKVDDSGIINVIAGDGSAGYSGDGGLAQTASLAGPQGVAVDGLGNVYIADSGNCRVRKVSNGLITTVAGNGSCGPLTGPAAGVATSASIDPAAVAVDSSGNLYVASIGGNRVWKISQGIIENFAGNGNIGSGGDGGPAVSASLNFPRSVAVDRSGVVYIADIQNHRIRAVTNGVINTVASVFVGSLATDNGGSLYFSDSRSVYQWVNGAAVKIAGSGDFMFSGDGGSALAAGMAPIGIGAGAAGTVYVADSGSSRIRRISNGVIQTVAGNGTTSSSSDGALPTAVILSSPNSVAVDTSGNLYIADGGNSRILKVTNGVISTVATTSINNCFPPCAGALAMDGADTLYFVDYPYVRKLAHGAITTVAGNGSTSYNGDGMATSLGLSPVGIALSPDGDVYIIDRTFQTIRKVHGGMITTIAGRPAGFSSGDGGPATDATFGSLHSLAFNYQGDLYIADDGTLRKISGGIITTVDPGLDLLNVVADTAGNIYLLDRSSVKLISGIQLAGSSQIGFSGDGGQSIGALLNYPVGAARGPGGKIYIADSRNNRVRVLTLTPSAYPFGSFDTPTDNVTGVTGAIPVTGWALDSVGVSNLGIWREPIGPEPAASNGLVFIGAGVFVNGTRPDVQAAYASFPSSNRAGWGYLLLTNTLPGNGNGVYKLHAIATNLLGATTDLGVKTISVDNAHGNKPFGTLDSPDQGGTVSGSQVFGFGWALTPAPACIPTDGSTITVFIDGVPSGHPVYNQMRSDIVAVFPGYCNTNGAVGFFPINATTLTSGLHTMSWAVYDSNGRGDGVGSRYFNVQNSGNGMTAPTGRAPQAVKLGGRRSLESLKLDPRGVHVLEVQEMDRIELDLGAKSSGSLPIGSTLRDGVFYWQLGPGFLGDYPLQFKLPDDRSVSLRIKVKPKSFPSAPIN